jgi:xylulokinase
VIGVDIGTQSTKAVLVDGAGRIVAQSARSYQVETPQALWAEQWPDVWLEAVVGLRREVVVEAAVDPASIRGLCVSSLYGGSGIPVDAGGGATHPCLIWMDRRAQDEVDWVKASVDLERLYDVTGNGVDSYYGFTKILWLREKRPMPGARRSASCRRTATSTRASPARSRSTTARPATSAASTTSPAARGRARCWRAWASRAR